VCLGTVLVSSAWRQLCHLLGDLLECLLEVSVHKIISKIVLAEYAYRVCARSVLLYCLLRDYVDACL